MLVSYRIRWYSFKNPLRILWESFDLTFRILWSFRKIHKFLYSTLFQIVKQVQSRFSPSVVMIKVSHPSEDFFVRFDSGFVKRTVTAPIDAWSPLHSFQGDRHKNSRRHMRNRIFLFAKSKIFAGWTVEVISLSTILFPEFWGQQNRILQRVFATTAAQLEIKQLLCYEFVRTFFEKFAQ